MYGLLRKLIALNNVIGVYMRIIKIIIIIHIVILLAGCWDRRELSGESVITGMAVDKGERSKFRLTVETTEAREVTAKTASGNAPSYVYSIEGDTIAELSTKLNTGIATHPIYSHMYILAISEEIAEEGLIGFLDFVDRNREMRDDFNIVVVKKGSSAGDILQVINMYKKSASLKLARQLDTMEKDYGGAPDLKLNDFVRVYNAKGQSPVLPAVRLNGDAKKGGNVENLKNETPEAKVDLESLAVIKHGKLAGYGSLEEVRYLLFVENKIKTTTLTAQCEDDKKFAYEVTHSKTVVTAKEKNNVPNFHIKIKTEGYLDGIECLENFHDISTFGRLEKRINSTMEKNIKEFIQKASTEYNADIFGLGEMLRDQDYKHFKKYEMDNNWDEGFSKSKIDISFDAEIKRGGLRTNRFNNSR
ncbi:Ger(x)C family spore germination protein [Niallia taxi]|uniref:Ger(x)C family spore germination protein n=1 Tax=Niallia taxi TaxID=2499688 RepID=UPI0021A80CD7|nr:Ger(x)C family spore germination protein [Niallia taxi]MCT2345779.1 Ger(x)C family spore germination protein [Niallia taxi]